MLYKKLNLPINLPLANDEEIEVNEVENNIIIFKINGNRFLHHMIRYLVGTMVGVCQGRISNKEFKLLLINPKKDVQILKAPPQGLFLEKIKYD